MKRIGLLGGMSWESTVEYYRLLNTGVRERRGGLNSADVMLRSVNFAELEELFVADRWDLVGERLSAEARLLEQAGAQLLALCTNTGHRVIDSITSSVSTPVIDIIDVAADALRRVDATRVLLLGTRFTMSPGFYIDRLSAAGFDVDTPEELDAVDDIIFGELCVGVCSDDGRRIIEDAIAAGVTRGCDAVLLACTELELLEPLDSAVPVLPTTRLHCEAIIEASLSPDADEAE